MKSFLQKTVIGVAVALLAVVVFWNNLTATAFWGLALHQTSELSSVTTTPGTQLMLDEAGATASSTSYGALQIPHIFASTQVLNETDTIVVFSDTASNAYYLISPMPTYRANFLSDQTSRTQAEQAAMCEVLGQVYQAQPCQSDQVFVDTIMQVSTKTAGLFSNSQRKAAAATFLLLKSTYLPQQTQQIAPFSTAAISGHLAIAPNQSVAYLFDQQAVGYEIAFINMNQEQTQMILARIAENTAKD